jgi:hypothetical protein
MRCLILLPVLSLLAGCALPPRGNPEFDDATSFAFLQFDVESQADMAFAMRQLEEQLYLSVDLDSDSSEFRALSPEPLTDAALENLERPDRPAENLRAVTVIRAGTHRPEEHVAYITLSDQLPVEPSSEDHYDRTLADGGDCWEDKSCEFLMTENDLTKDNAAVGSIRYDLNKDYRWVDMNLPDPDTVSEGEEPINEGEARWAIAARSWTKQEWANDDETAWIRQAYSIEIWMPRDGGGYIRSDGDENLDGGAWTHDSSGGGVLRMMTLWGENETSLNAGEELEITLIRNGIDGIFETQQEYLDAS